MTNTQTITYGDGFATITTERGRAVVLVKKCATLNPSARGGAYRTEWVATARGRKFARATRRAAVKAAADSLRERGFAL